MTVLRTPRTLSPYMLIQEFLRDEPWKLLVACIMLNQTRAKQVHGIINEFFARYPTPEDFFLADATQAKRLLKSLGFMNRRYERLHRMTIGFINNTTLGIKLDCENLHGVGKYAADSFKIFCQGYLVEDVKDKELKNYVRWAKEEAESRGVYGPERCHPGPGGVQRGL